MRCSDTDCDGAQRLILSFDHVSSFFFLPETSFYHASSNWHILLLLHAFIWPKKKWKGQKSWRVERINWCQINTCVSGCGHQLNWDDRIIFLCVFRPLNEQKISNFMSDTMVVQNPQGINRIWVVTYRNQWLALMRCDRIEWMTMEVLSRSTMRHVSIDIDVTNAIDKRKAFRIGKAAFTPVSYSKRLILPFRNNFAWLFVRIFEIAATIYTKINEQYFHLFDIIFGLSLHVKNNEHTHTPDHNSISIASI